MHKRESKQGFQRIIRVIFHVLHTFPAKREENNTTIIFHDIKLGLI